MSNPNCLDPPQSWNVVNHLRLRELATVALPTSARAVLEPHRSWQLSSPTHLPLPSLPFLLCFWNTPISGKKLHPICQGNMLRDWRSGNLFHFQLVNGPTENFRVLDSQSTKVNRALITQPKASSPSFHSWPKALPRLSFPTLLSPFQGPSLHPIRSEDLMSPRQLPPPYTHWATRPFLMVAPSTKYPHMWSQSLL